MGFTSIRLGVEISCLQPVNLGLLNQTELAHITTVVEQARSLGIYVLIDPHDSGEMYNSTIGSMEQIGVTLVGSVPNSYFADVWGRMAKIYSKYPNVYFN